MSKRGRVRLTMPDDLKQQARAQAILQGKDLSQVVRALLKLWVEGKVKLPESEEGGAAED